MLEIAKNQITNLETNLNNLMKLYNELKMNKTSDSSDNNNNNNNSNSNLNKQIEIKHAISNNNNSDNNNNNTNMVLWKDCNLINDKKINNPILLINLLNEILSDKYDIQLNQLLQVSFNNYYLNNYQEADLMFFLPVYCKRMILKKMIIFQSRNDQDS